MAKKNLAILRKIININLIQICGFIKHNQAKKEMKFYTLNEFKEFRSELPEDEYKLIFNTLYFTGMRIGELQALSFSNFRENEKCLFVHSNYDPKNKVINETTKNGKNRYIYLDDKLFNDLLAHKRNYQQYKDFSGDKLIFGYYESPPQGKLLRTERKKPLSTIMKTMKTKLKKSGYTTSGIPMFHY